ALEQGLKSIADTYASLAARGSLSSEEAGKRSGLIVGGGRLEDASDADLVIEAVFETMEIKKEVFSKLDAIVRPNAVLATNTSYLDVNAIAEMTKRPGDVVGMHFFSPANIMK